MSDGIHDSPLQVGGWPDRKHGEGSLERRGCAAVRDNTCPKCGRGGLILWRAEIVLPGDRSKPANKMGCEYCDLTWYELRHNAKRGGWPKGKLRKMLKELDAFEAKSKLENLVVGPRRTKRTARRHNNVLGDQADKTKAAKHVD